MVGCGDEKMIETKNKNAKRPLYIGVPWSDKMYHYYSDYCKSIDQAIEKAIKLVLTSSTTGAFSLEAKEGIAWNDTTTIYILRAVDFSKIEYTKQKLGVENGKMVVKQPASIENIVCKGTGELLDSNKEYGGIVHYFSAPDRGWFGRNYYDLIMGESCLDCWEKIQNQIKYVETSGFENSFTGYGGLVVGEYNFKELKKQMDLLSK